MGKGREKEEKRRHGREFVKREKDTQISRTSRERIEKKNKGIKKRKKEREQDSR